MNSNLILEHGSIYLDEDHLPQGHTESAFITTKGNSGIDISVLRLSENPPYGLHYGAFKVK